MSIIHNYVIGQEFYLHPHLRLHRANGETPSRRVYCSGQARLIRGEDCGCYMACNPYYTGAAKCPVGPDGKTYREDM